MAPPSPAEAGPQPAPPPRSLGDSALGWPGAGASPARLVGPGRATAPLAAPLRSGGEGAPRSAGLGWRPGTPTGTGRDGAAPGGGPGWGPQGRPGLAVGRSGSASDLGVGPLAGSAAPGARDPSVRPSGRLNSSGESWGRRSLRRPQACHSHGDPCVRAPAGTPATGSGCLSLPGPRRLCPGASGPPSNRAPFPGSWQHGTLGLGGVSPRPFPTLVSCGIPVCEPATSCPGMGRQSVLQSVLTTPFTGLLGSCSAMGHQASDLSLPLAPRGPALLDPLLSGMGPLARFPPGFIWKVVSAFLGAELRVLRTERVVRGLWEPRLMGSLVPVGPRT